MLRTKHLYWMERIASFTMMLAIGYAIGIAYPEVPALYWVAVMLVGACTKLWVHHKLQKLQKSQNH